MLYRSFLLLVCSVLVSAGLASGQDTVAETQPEAVQEAVDTQTVTPRNVRIGAWNIEWLGQPNKRYGKSQGNLQKAEDLADYIIAARVEALALEEICPTNLNDPEGYDPETDGPLDSLVLRSALEIVSKRTKSEWTFRLFPSSGTTRSTNQLTGIAWDASALTVLGESWPVIAYEKGQSWTWYRPPWATAFSTGEGMTDMIIIPIHMKAFEESAPRRAKEAEELVGALNKFEGDPDIMIIGDSNVHNPDEEALAIYKAAGFIDLNRRGLSTHVGEVPLDRVFIPNDQPEFSKKFFHVFSKPYMARRRLKPTDFSVRYSDHYMVITTVKAGEDDD
jgi:hypothetical protein